VAYTSKFIYKVGDFMAKKPKTTIAVDIDDYYNIFSKLSPKQKQVFLYLTQPENIIKKENEIAEEVNVSTKTLSRMSRDAKEFAQKICLAKMLCDIPAIADKFIQKAKEGSFNHGKLIFEMTGIHTPKQETKNENNNINSVDDKTAKLLDNVLDRLGK